MALFDTIRAGASGAGDYEISRSLRFSGASETRLNFTPSSDGNRKKWTWAAWIKRGSVDRRYFWSAYTSGPNVTSLQFHDTGNLNFEDWLSGYRFHLRTAAGFMRDPSAWFHLVVYVDTAQSTASDRVKLYVNGAEPEFEATVYPTQNLDTKFNTGGLLHAIGTEGTNQRLWFDGYMADVYFLDGYAYDPSYFGETDATTGQWIPKKYEGSFGTNGYYLNFSDNSSTSALGTDSSGQGNNNTPVNFSVTAGSGNDSLEDTPTNNFSVINPLAGYQSTFEVPTNGNLDFSLGNSEFAFSSFEIPTSGKWYAEVVFTTFASGRCGITNLTTKNDNKWHGIDHLGGEIRVDDSSVQSGLSPTIGDNKIVGIKVDRDAGTIAFTVDGSDSGTAVNISSMTAPENLVFAVGRNSSSGSAPTGFINFGQRAFSHLPTGYKSLCSANLPNPTIKLANQYFNTVLYTGNNSTNVITGVGFQPDWFWIKNRSTTGEDHHLFDAVRGINKALYSNGTDQETTGFDSPTSNNNITAVSSDGFTITGNGSDGEGNLTGRTYVAWNWNAGGSTASNSDGSITSSVRANTTAGFSIISYTGTGSAGATVGHGLGVAPDLIVIKNRDDSSAAFWAVYHSEAFNSASDPNILYFNSTQAEADDTNILGTSVTINSTVFSLGDYNGVNGSGDDMISYCFSEVAGFSKFGKFTGNGNADGTFVFTGFRPAWVMIKQRSGTAGWMMYDSKRRPQNTINKYLQANNTNAEVDSTTDNPIDFLSNGMKMRYSNTATNQSGGTYIYLCFAESPFKYARAG